MSAQTDRELLELAAKAVGLAEDWPAPRYEIQWNGYGLWCSGMGDGLLWNPLTDDGDALRLAVKLALLVDAGRLGDPSETTVVWPFGDYAGVTEHHGSDPYAATRRAIIRTAAALGRNA